MTPKCYLESTDWLEPDGKWDEEDTADYPELRYLALLFLVELGEGPSITLISVTILCNGIDTRRVRRWRHWRHTALFSRDLALDSCNAVGM
jgi:hypothetical protein